MRRKRFAIFFLTILATGCSNNVRLQSPLRKPPLVEKTQASVMLTYTAALRNHACLVDKGYIAESWPVALGPPSMEMFDTIFRSLFTKVAIVDTAPARRQLPNDFLIAEIGISKFTGCEARWPIVGSRIEILYEVAFKRADGKLIALLHGHGSAGPKDNLREYGRAEPTIEVESEYLEAAISVAMRKAAASFLIAFEKNPEIRQWLGK